MITQTTKDRLIAALESGCKDGKEVRFTYSYSGRGMYGSECIGIYGSGSKCKRLIANIIQNMAATLAEEENAENALAEFNEAVGVLLEYSQDSMGCETIFYWYELKLTR